MGAVISIYVASINLILSAQILLNFHNFIIYLTTRLTHKLIQLFTWDKLTNKSILLWNVEVLSVMPHLAE